MLFKELYRERCLGGVGAAVFAFLAPLAFGVYLVHNLLVDLLSRLLQWWPAASVQMVVVSYVAVTAASVAVVYVISRIKPLCYVLTGQAYRPWFKRASAPVDEVTAEPAAEPGPTGAAPTPQAPAGRAAAGAAGEGVGNQEAPTAEILLPKVWRPEPAKVRPPVAPGDTAERPGRGHRDGQQPPGDAS
jgi:hypothetical protein